MFVDFYRKVKKITSVLWSKKCLSIFAGQLYSKIPVTVTVSEYEEGFDAK